MNKEKTAKKILESNGVIKETERINIESKLKIFLDKEGLSIEPYFQCINSEVMKEFKESPFVKMKLISPALRVVETNKAKNGEAV